MAEQLEVGPIDLPAMGLIAARCRAGEPPIPIEIRAELGFTTGAMTSLVDRLESNPFVVRKPHPGTGVKPL